MDVMQGLQYKGVIDEICDLNWRGLTSDEMVAAAWGYYFFSIQFRENLTTARELYPEDSKLQQLEREECDTNNLSPWPGVAVAGEKMNHDEFMRRALELTSVAPEKIAYFEGLGEAYLTKVRTLSPLARATSIASYEDGGLESVFKAMLQFSNWDNPLLQAFRHFLSEHVRFDSDPEQGHGALSRHMVPDDRVLPLWEAFRTIMVKAVPSLAH
jgi:hypothetical protein